MGYGHVTIERAAENGWLGHCRVTFFGEDVTDRCVELNDETGDITLQVHGADGPLLNEAGDGLELRRYHQPGTVIFEVVQS